MSWILIHPSRHLGGQFVAHHLATDVVSQGNSPAHAYRMCLEAIPIASGTKRAPDEFYTVLGLVLDLGERLPPSEERDVWAVQVPAAADYEFGFLRRPTIAYGLDLAQHPGTAEAFARACRR